MTIMLVGEMPSTRSDGVAFNGPSGRKLSELIGRPLRPTFQPVNLFEKQPTLRDGRVRWDPVAARLKARVLLTAYADADRWILCGRRVAQAFGLPRDLPFFVPRYIEILSKKPIPLFGRKGSTWSYQKAVVIPHPSGLNRWWNDQQNTRRARACLLNLVESTTGPW